MVRNKKYDGEKEWKEEGVKVKQVGVCAKDKRPPLPLYRLVAPGRREKGKEREGMGEE